MRSFASIVALLFALLACAFAQESDAYDATVYITSTVYRVNTITASGTSTGVLANKTSTISASYGTGYPVSSPSTNGTAVLPTTAQPSPSQFTGAADSLTANVYLAALVAGFGYLVL